jgi:hypothetical protein
LAELDARKVTDIELGLSTRDWLAREAGLPSSVAGQQVRVARALRAPLDQVAEAMADGRLSWEQARVLAQACNPRISHKLAEIQGELIDLAQGSVFDAWKKEIAGIVELLDEDGGHDPHDDVARNHLSAVPTIDGVTHVAGMLVGEGAEVARQSLETAADELFRRFTADHERCPEIEVPPRKTLVALAFIELCRRGLATDLNSTAAPRTGVSLVIEADDPVHATTPAGVRLADGTTRTLRCDPEITAIIRDRLGVPLDMGRTVRFATPAQRKALAIRDGGCVWPGCPHPPSWCDAHHIDHHHAGGRTDLARMALLCRRHHGVTHRKGWSMLATPDSWFIWTTPTGRRLYSQRHGRQPPDPDRAS